MTLITLSGCEKAGKTTLARVLEERHGARYVHHGPVTSSYSFMDQLRKDATDPGLVVWDRSWVCEAVYAYHYQRAYSAFKNDWWLGEWVFGRAVQSLGVSAVLLGPSVAELEAKRTPDDLDIPPATERSLYLRYARRFGLQFYANMHDPDYATALADQLVARATDAWWTEGRSRTPPCYAGPRWPRVVFVGDVRNAESRAPGSWLPFSTRTTRIYGRALGDLAFRCGWTNTDGSPEIIEHAKLVVACGATAQRFVLQCTGAKATLPVPHPSWLYRWAKAVPERSMVESKIRLAVEATLGTSN